MKYRKKYRKKYKYKKRKPSRKKMVILRISGVSIVPDRLLVRLKYSTQQLSAAATSVTRRFALNGLYDPDLTGVGHQPKAFDEWMAFYEKYEVKSSTIKFNLINRSGVEIQACCMPSLSSTALTTISEMQEAPYARYVSLSGDDGGSATKFLMNKMNVKKLEGRNTYSVNFTGSTSANPVALQEWHLLISSADNATNYSWTYQCEIVYSCIFYNRRQLSQS